ncbi:flagellar basal body rod protein FlgC [Cohnella suwonensis]|uniref:Flagellar basal-body rod protein FlgC n=1 Tax=Cohnella suwonensis TaxID=696072 RepID=A0ABW0M1Q1_9BACL
MKLEGFSISASALSAQRLRMDVIAANIANAETTRAGYVNGKFVPYRRKTVVMEAVQPKFQDVFAQKLNGNAAQGVQVTAIKEDSSPFKQVYNPSHPDADENGMVYMPNVDMLKEQVDLLEASRSYEANITALNARKSMFMKALEMGR